MTRFSQHEARRLGDNPGPASKGKSPRVSLAQWDASIFPERS